MTVSDETLLDIVSSKLNQDFPGRLTIRKHVLEGGVYEVRINSDVPGSFALVYATDRWFMWDDQDFSPEIVVSNGRRVSLKRTWKYGFEETIRTLFNADLVELRNVRTGTTRFDFVETYGRANLAHAVRGWIFGSETIVEDFGSWRS